MTQEKEATGSYKQLVVWETSMKLATEIYRLTEQFPKHEQFGITSQMRRAAISIPSNIAEGSRRGTKRDFRQFAFVAYGSGSELETQVELAKRLNYATLETAQHIDQLLLSTMKMLNRLIQYLGE